MKTLSPPKQNGMTVYNAIIADKRSKKVKQRLTKKSQDVAIAYSNYISAAPAVDTLMPITLFKCHKDSLLHAYEQSTASLKTLRDALFESAIKSKCPFCQIGTHATLDHYLPKEKYPEFSVLPQNLIPACDECNRHKRSLIVDEGTAVRLFIHPYYDIIPNVNFIKARLKVKKNILTIVFETYHNQLLTPQQYAHIDNHFRTLKLADRFNKSSIAELGDMRDALKKLAKRGPGFLKAKLIKQMNIYSNVGHNNWRRILFETLANDNLFLTVNHKYL